MKESHECHAMHGNDDMSGHNLYFCRGMTVHCELDQLSLVSFPDFANLHNLYMQVIKMENVSVLDLHWCVYRMPCESDSIVTIYIYAPLYITTVKTINTSLKCRLTSLIPGIWKKQTIASFRNYRHFWTYYSPPFPEPQK